MAPYASLEACVRDLHATGRLRVVDYPADPRLELAYIQRRAFQAGGPALLFRRPKGCSFPMLANLFGTRERVAYIFRDTLKTVRSLLRIKASPKEIPRNPFKTLKMLPALANMRARRIKDAPVLSHSCKLKDLPRLVSWPLDGGPFITLPLVYTRNPENGSENLGMYRVQLSGNDYAPDEAGLHYQLQRGIGTHHAAAMTRGVELPAHIHVGGPPALSIAAVMPMPEGISELVFAGLLGGRRVNLAQPFGFGIPVLADADFLIRGKIGPALKPEGPFGDHVGYYSLRHPFPVLKVEAVWHRTNAIWPFTSVGRPPQEDTIFGDFIHELTAPLVGQVFEGVSEVHAVDAAGVHPLLLALGSERYTAYEARRRPRELLTQAMHLLGTTQTAQAKFLLMAAREDNPGLSVRDIGGFLRHLLERTDFANDLHFITHTNCDTLDYTGLALHEGSKLVWVGAGEKRRDPGTEIAGLPGLPPGFGEAALAAPGILLLKGPVHSCPRGDPDPCLENELSRALSQWREREKFPLIVVVDDVGFAGASLENFLWTTFTRTDPAVDSYGVNTKNHAKHWSCEPPLVLDARMKSFHAPPLEDDPEIVARVESLAAKNGPLAGIFG